MYVLNRLRYQRLRPTQFPLTTDPSMIPPGTSVYLPPWVLQRDPRNFTFPDKFWPERWLIASGQLRYEDARLPSSVAKHDIPEFVHNEAAFAPFSIGPMNCPGKGLALMEMRLVLCHFMQKLELSFPKGYDPMDWDRQLEDRFVMKIGVLPVLARRRD